MTAESEKPERKAIGAAMEGGGYYNRHSAMQAAGISALMPDWEKTVREVTLDDGPIVIADYGSSQGRNSMAPMRIAIEEIRARTGAATPINVIHTDLPSNDFAALFTALENDPSSYLAGTSNVFPSAVGRTYFEQIFPAASVHLGWNTWTLQWLSGSAINAPDCLHVQHSLVPDVRARLRQRQAEDWRRFLECRSRELKVGAKMVTAFVVYVAGEMGLEEINGELWNTVQDLGREGLLSDDEQLRMTLPIAGRSIDDIRAPFGEQGKFADLKIEKVEILKVPDPAWTAFQIDSDARQFGISHASTKRAYAGPTIAGVLESRADKQVVLDKLFDRFALRIAATPRPHECNLALVILAKGAN